jgi:AraC-like DNA-binding protein
MKNYSLSGTYDSTPINYLKTLSMNLTKEEVENILHMGEKIRKNVRYHTPIRDLAKETGLNPSKLKSGFKQLHGTGIYTYLMLARMERAKEMLQTTDKVLKEIALVVGYKSTNSFIKTFKKVYGTSPALWKRQQTKLFLHRPLLIVLTLLQLFGSVIQ